MSLDQSALAARPERRGAAALGLLGGIAGFLLTLAITLLGLVVVTFVIGRVVPIDPVLAVVGDRASGDVYARVRAEMGLDLPLLEQFRIYLVKAVTGDFGRSVLTTNPVIDDIRTYFPATIELATLGTLIGTVIGIPLGVFAAVRSGSFLDQVVRIVGLVGYSVPIFWLGLMALLLFYARLDWVAGPGRLDIAYDYMVTPVTGMITVDALMQGQTEVFWNAVSHLVLPACLLGYFSLAYISRMTRALLLNELGQEYVITARVKGLSETRVIWRHALRNAAVPLLTVVVLSYATLLEGSVLTETVFAWPGIGSYITNSLQNADMNAVLGGTLVVGAAFVTLNLLSDLLYRLLDPRTR
ncbi:ABC transporter permease [Kaistia geumhonensis]|uniref:Peptide/nickel transport system permease protein n=1 Tax=Kaistia geumhonensis TaxID=410839 RepID=A0ABU0M5J4_9HYPH|nr:peptide/nickel transport system permease protein [Kaistia geumhonensis]